MKKENLGVRTWVAALCEKVGGDKENEEMMKL